MERQRRPGLTTASLPALPYPVPPAHGASGAAKAEVLNMQAASRGGLGRCERYRLVTI